MRLNRIPPRQRLKAHHKESDHVKSPLALLTVDRRDRPWAYAGGTSGYVLIQTDNYNVETSVTGLVIILILGVVVLFAVEWILRRIFRTGAHTRGWFVGRKRRRARKQTEQALLKLAEGDYQQVEKLMSKNADHAEQPVVNYLLAAEAAQQRGDEARANQHLERASELSPKDPIPVEITCPPAAGP